MKHERFPGFTVGVTGGIGSGKSAVCAILENLGRPVVHADPLARGLMESDARVRAEITSLLGPDAYIAGGKLNRSLVANLIFNDRQLLRRVNAIVHPAVTKEIRDRLLQMSEDQRRPYSVIEAALIYESGLDSLLHAVVAIDAPFELRVARVTSRDNTDGKDVLKRAQAQFSPEKIMKRADFVIGNQGSLEELKERVTFVHSLLISMSHERCTESVNSS